MSKLQDLSAERNMFIAQMDDKIWQTFLEELKELFAKYPHVLEFSTPGYAPYFADGDACTWSFNTDCSKMAVSEEEKDENEYDDDDEDDQSYCNVRQYHDLGNGKYEFITPEKYKPLEEYVELTCCVPDALFEKICEDGRLVFNRDGSFYAEDYSHD